MFINQWNKLNFSDFHGHKRIAADIGLVQISATINCMKIFIKNFFAAKNEHKNIIF
jgi:hypothetical protein